mgnify:CR=1 FL=1
MRANQVIKKAAQIIKSAHNGVILTGAGVSTPSGIPDFRSEDKGLWEQFDPLEFASLSAFRHNPEKFFLGLRELAKKIYYAKPNLAHFVIAQLQKLGHIRTIITQNIDGLHQTAGSHRIIELHGTIHSLTCPRCYHKYHEEEAMIETFLETGGIPKCPKCNVILKPNMVLFEEQLPINTWLQAQEASKNCDLFIVAGSSLEALPAAGLPMKFLENGTSLIIINMCPTYLDLRAEAVLRGDVVQIMPQLLTEVLS